MVVLLAVGYGVLGLVLGAFLNVLVDRVPDKLPLRGPQEGEPVAPWSVAGVPLQPWLARLGRGPDGTRLPQRWLRVELLAAVAFGALGARYGDQTGVIALLILAAYLIPVSVIDLQVLRIPDRLTYPALLLSVVAIAAVSFRGGYGDAVRAAGLGMLGYAGFLVIFHLVYPRGLGFGDVKLALVMGLHLGWMGWDQNEPIMGPVTLVMYGLMAGHILGFVFGIAVMVWTRRRGEYPFGPALALGCFGVVLFAPELRY
jgi:leader peptidase (prepilin peptidase) / N-methyltransferase